MHSFVPFYRYMVNNSQIRIKAIILDTIIAVQNKTRSALFLIIQYIILVTDFMPIAFITFLIPPKILIS